MTHLSVTGDFRSVRRFLRRVLRHPVTSSATLAAVMMVLALGCRGGDRATGPGAEATDLQMGPASVALAPGDTVQLEATPVDENGNPVSGYTVSWSSGDSTVATVDGDGTVTGLSAGSTTVTAAASKQGQASSSISASLQANKGKGSDNGQGKKKGLKKQSNVTVTESGLITNLEPAAYEKDTLETSDSVYVDRAYEISGVPSGYGGWRYVRTANDDKNTTGDSAVTFTLTDTARVALAYDQRATQLPGWLTEWTATGEVLETTDVNYDVYTRLFLPGDVALGGNLSDGAEGAESMYVLSATRSDSAPDDTTTSSGSDTTTATGSLEVITSTTGDSLDSDGYKVTVDSGSGQSVGINDTTVYTDLTADSHTVELTGVASNCSTSGSNPRSVSVVESNTVSTSFEITCGTTTDGHTNQPDNSTRITHHPFDDLDNGGTWNVVDGENLTIVEDTSAPTSPPNVLQHHYPAGSSGGGNVGGRLVSPAITDVLNAQTVYAHLQIKWSNSFEGHQSGVNKFLYFRVANPASGSGDFLYTKATGADSEPLNLKFIRQNSNLEPAQTEWSQNKGPAGADRLARGEWHDIEIIVRLNDPGSANGELHVWLNGVRIMEYYDVTILSGADSGPWDVFNMDQIWGGVNDTMNNSSYIWVDDFYGSAK